MRVLPAFLGVNSIYTWFLWTQKRESNFLKLGLVLPMGCLPWGLGTKPMFFIKAASALNCEPFLQS